MVNTCDLCGGSSFHCTDYEVLCRVCGSVYPHLHFVSSSTSYQHPVGNSRYDYRRESHFNDCLRLAQGVCKRKATPKELSSVFGVLTKQGYRDPRAIKPTDVRVALKALRFTKLYESTPRVLEQLTGRTTPMIPGPVRACMTDIFHHVARCYETYRPPGRKNFLSYSFTVVKIMQLCGCRCVLWYENVPTLKCAQKLETQDRIWRKICRQMGWPLIGGLSPPP